MWLTTLSVSVVALTYVYSIGNNLLMIDSESSSKKKDLKIFTKLILRNDISKKEIRNSITDEKLLLEIDFKQDTIFLNSQTLVFEDGYPIQIIDRFNSQ
ncbi:MAG: hypothetical protein ACE364_08090 [Chlorobiota bacterium]